MWIAVGVALAVLVAAVVVRQIIRRQGTVSAPMTREEQVIAARNQQHNRSVGKHSVIKAQGSGPSNYGGTAGRR